MNLRPTKKVGSSEEEKRWGKQPIDAEETPGYAKRGEPWTDVERAAFEKGLDEFGPDFKRIQRYVPTRTIEAVRNHARKIRNKTNAPTASGSKPRASTSGKRKRDNDVEEVESSANCRVPQEAYSRRTRNRTGACRSCRAKKANGMGTSLFFMARDKDFSSKIDAGEREELFLDGKDGSKGSICFHYSERDDAWNGCFCKFVKMILGVPIRNKNNHTYYDQFKVNGHVRRECFDENGQVTGNRVLWNKFRMFLRYVYLPAVEGEIEAPPKELKRREEVEQVIHWLKLVDDAHQGGESINKKELHGFFQSLHDLLRIHEKRIAEEKRVTNAHKFLFVHAFRQFFGSDVTGHIGYFADDRPVM
jgi:hypothetical protein